MNSRALAARLLQQVLYDGTSLTAALLSPALQRLPAQERSLLRDLCFGTLRWQPRLQFILQQLLSKPCKAADKDIECLLLTGLYQLLYQRVPDHAAVNETVNACKKLKKDWASRVVNGVLRNFLRQRDDLLAKADAQPSSRYALPAWLLSRLQAAWAEDWETIAQASNTHAPLTLRVNQRHYTPAAYQGLLAAAGIAAAPVSAVSSALILETPLPVEQLPAFQQGAVSVQDAAAQLAAHVLDCQPGMRVLDACAAPGGKTAHLLEKTPELHLTALDSSAVRLQRLQANLMRLGLTARVVAADAGDLDTWWDGQLFDAILLDAPCSATGVMRRHPDIKVLRRASDIAALQQEQARLLNKLWPTLRIGGKLLYATCSILPEENQQQVAAFLQANPDAIPLPLPVTWGRPQIYGRQILPGEQQMDGFYYALLQKVAQETTT
ncbi:MAG: 16S rRNA (cytosine(967)-C(5))-methyltransferase RsmB [Thiothrix sp.]